MQWGFMARRDWTNGLRNRLFEVIQCLHRANKGKKDYKNTVNLRRVKDILCFSFTWLPHPLFFALDVFVFAYKKYFEAQCIFLL